MQHPTNQVSEKHGKPHNNNAKSKRVKNQGKTFSKNKKEWNARISKYCVFSTSHQQPSSDHYY